MVLRRARGAREVACVGGAVDAGAEHLVHEVHVVGDDRRRKVVRHAFAAVEHRGEVAVGVGDDDLEGPEKLLGPDVEVVLLHGGGQRHHDRRGLPRAVAGGDAVPLERLPSPEQLGAGDDEHLIHVALDLRVRPREHGAAREVAEAAARREGPEALEDAGPGDPVRVREEHRLRRALLAAEGVGVLVALPRDEFLVLRIGHIGP
mmetsp:Transcript_43012/g.134959  ORF Transcript_43012/g.134959 Transcript_43012/m.134959 type:complete len:204 (+) Transcript_43012:230-841(+)